MMSISQWFQRFKANIQVPNGTLISQRTQRITTRLNSTFWNTDSSTAHRFYAGSYGRNTAIKGVSDIDLVFELPWSIFKQYDDHLYNGQSQLLQAVRHALLASYPSTAVSGDGQIVCVPFTDGMLYEIVPAFPHQDGSYTYPDSNNGGRWRTMDPKKEMTIFGIRNADCNGNVVELARMVRAWRREWNVQMKGMLIDTLMYQFMLTAQYKDRSYTYYDWLSRDFFEFLAGQNPSQTYWLTPGANRQIPGGGFQYRSKQAYNLSLEAIRLESGDPSYPYSAQAKWKEIYGNDFL